MSPQKKTLLENLANCCSSCSNCVMHETRNSVVLGNGNINAEIAIVGEAPGREEDLCGKPFQGDAGKRLENELLTLAELSRSEVYITNTCKCRPINPHGGNRPPTPCERAACKPFLLKELEIIGPKLVVLLGATPLKTFFGNNACIRDYHGRIWRFGSLLLYPTYHPSRCARQWNKELLSDFESLNTLLKDL